MAENKKTNKKKSAKENIELDNEKDDVDSDVDDVDDYEEEEEGEIDEMTGLREHDRDPTEEEVHYHDHIDRHTKSPRLAQIILGGQDGLVNTLGVILGVAAASNSKKVVLAGGLAATFAESISMGAVEYTSKLAEIAFYKSEHNREKRHVEKVPVIERKEVREMYLAKGFKGQLLEDTVNTICANKEVWVESMMAEEHRLSDESRTEVFIDSLWVFFAALFGSLIPLAPFFFSEPSIYVCLISIAISSVVLFIVGAFKSISMRVGNWAYAGGEMMVIGTISALCGWGIGFAFDQLWPDD